MAGPYLRPRLQVRADDCALTPALAVPALHQGMLGTGPPGNAFPVQQPSPWHRQALQLKATSQHYPAHTCSVPCSLIHLSNAERKTTWNCHQVLDSVLKLGPALCPFPLLLRLQGRPPKGSACRCTWIRARWPPRQSSWQAWRTLSSPAAGATPPRRVALGQGSVLLRLHMHAVQDSLQQAVCFAAMASMSSKGACSACSLLEGSLPYWQQANETLTPESCLSHLCLT